MKPRVSRQEKTGAKTPLVISIEKSGTYKPSAKRGCLAPDDRKFTKRTHSVSRKNPELGWRLTRHTEGLWQD